MIYLYTVVVSVYILILILFSTLMRTPTCHSRSIQSISSYLSILSLSDLIDSNIHRKHSSSVSILSWWSMCFISSSKWYPTFFSNCAKTKFMKWMLQSESSNVIQGGFLLFIWILETRYCVAKDDLELLILLSTLPKFWDYRHVSPFLASTIFN